MGERAEANVFDIGAGFDAGQVEGGLELGPYADHYRELFADVLDDGVITPEERERLTRVAQNLGLDSAKLEQLERAMIAAYEAHHRVSVVERWQAGVEEPAPASKLRETDAASALRSELERLRARVLELEEELREARAHVNVEIDFSSLEDDGSADSSERLRSKIARDPTNPELFAAYYEACQRSSDSDGACLAARALVALGAALPEHQRLVVKHQTEGLIAARRSLTAEHWLDDLNHRRLSLMVSQIFSLVTPAALVGRAAALQRDKKLPELGEDNRQDVRKTTITAVRALGWAAALLGLPAPHVYTDTAREVGYAHVPAVPPWSLLGKRVLSGCKPAEHAFLAGRHMAYYRAEFFARVLFPEVQELESLFLAALSLGNPSLPIPQHLESRVKPVRNALAPLLGVEHQNELRRQFKAFVGAGGRTNLLEWSEAVDKTAARAGFLLCDDLGIAMRLLEREEDGRGPLFTDLLAFSVSAEYAALRRHLGIAIT